VFSKEYYQPIQFDPSPLIPRKMSNNEVFGAKTSTILPQFEIKHPESFLIQDASSYIQSKSFCEFPLFG
jgi:hypothetical protein